MTDTAISLPAPWRQLADDDDRLSDPAVVALAAAALTAVRAASNSGIAWVYVPDDSYDGTTRIAAVLVVDEVSGDPKENPGEVAITFDDELEVGTGMAKIREGSTWAGPGQPVELFAALHLRRDGLPTLGMRLQTFNGAVFADPTVELVAIASSVESGALA